MNPFLIVLVVFAGLEFLAVVALILLLRIAVTAAKRYRDGYERECKFSDRWRDEAFRAHGLTPPSHKTREPLP